MHEREEVNTIKGDVSNSEKKSASVIHVLSVHVVMVEKKGGRVSGRQKRQEILCCIVLPL